MFLHFVSVLISFNKPTICKDITFRFDASRDSWFSCGSLLSTASATCAWNGAIYNQHRKLADQIKDVYFAGRLATYKYYNIDQVVAQALTLFKNLSQREGKYVVPDASFVKISNSGVKINNEATIKDGYGSKN